MPPLSNGSPILFQKGRLLTSFLAISCHDSTSRIVVSHKFPKLWQSSPDQSTFADFSGNRPSSPKNSFTEHLVQNSELKLRKRIECFIRIAQTYLR